MSDEEEDDREYVVLVNHEEQYSIWLAERPVPNGWAVVDRGRGTRADCLKYIGENWSDMRPKSVRDEFARRGE
jgi:MbtH protein